MSLIFICNESTHIVGFGEWVGLVVEFIWQALKLMSLLRVVSLIVTVCFWIVWIDLRNCLASSTTKQFSFVVSWLVYFGFSFIFWIIGILLLYHCEHALLGIGQGFIFLFFTTVSMLSWVLDKPQTCFAVGKACARICR